jgi:hypothetical protein
MLFRTRSIKTCARLMLAVLLLVQGIHFAKACILPSDAPAMAFTTGEPCKMPMGDEQDPITPNACLSQCLQGDQSSGACEFAVPPASNIALTLPASIDAGCAPRFTVSESIGNRSTPPLIRFCSLQL